MIDNNTDLMGMQFNEWTVLYRDFEKENEVTQRTGRKSPKYWYCLCSCGNEKSVIEQSLKNGASKVGQFVNNNHEAIGSILSGIGNIVSQMPGSPIKQRLERFGNAASDVGYYASGVGNMFRRMTRPTNLPRQQFSNTLTSKTGGGPPQIQQNSPPPQRAII